MKELFVGYVPKMPFGIARLVRRAVIVIFLVVGMIGVLLAISQNSFFPSVFEFDTVRDFEGMVEEQPYPALVVSRPGVQDAAPAFSRYLLVGSGKHDASSDVSGYQGKNVKLKAKLIYRDNQTLLEVMPHSVEAIGNDNHHVLPSTNVGPITVTGEIVDSKCYFGVMNPGAGKVHRDCASRCLNGGIPPALIAQDMNGRAVVYLLANSDGGRVSRDWAGQVAGRTVNISGQLIQSGDTLILHADFTTLHFVR